MRLLDLLLLSVFIFNNGCGISENTTLKEVAQNEISINSEKLIDSLNKNKNEEQIEFSKTNHGNNKKRIIKKYRIVPRIKVSIAGGVAGYFSPQFKIVNQGFKKNKEELLKNLGSEDTLLNILSVFALENAASIAGMLLTTECVIADKPEPKSAMPAMPGGGMGMDY